MYYFLSRQYLLRISTVLYRVCEWIHPRTAHKKGAYSKQKLVGCHIHIPGYISIQVNDKHASKRNGDTIGISWWTTLGCFCRHTTKPLAYIRTSIIFSQIAPSPKFKLLDIWYTVIEVDQILRSADWYTPYDTAAVVPTIICYTRSTSNDRSITILAVSAQCGANAICFIGVSAQLV